ncbi:hypothetical protein D3C73_871650 [compost metagenome]
MAACFNGFHEQVGQADAVEDVMGAHPLVAVVQLQVEEGENVFMEHVEIDGDGAFARAELVDADGGIVQLADPRDDAGAGVLVAADIGAACPHLAEVDTDASAHFAEPGYIGIRVEDAFERVVHGVDEAAGELSGHLFTGIGHGWCSCCHVDVAHCPVSLFDQLQALLLRLTVHQEHGDNHITLLRQLHDASVEIMGQIAVGQGEQPDIIE